MIRAGRARRRRAAGRALRPRPVLRLALPVLRLRRLRRAPPRAARGRASTRSSAALAGRARPAGRRARRGVRRPARPPLETVYLGGGTPSLLPADAVAGAARRRPRPVRHRRRRRGHARGEPRAGRARRRRRRSRAAGVTRLSLGAQSMSTPGCSGGSAGGTGPATSRDAVAEARDGRHRLGQPRPAVRRPRTARSATWIDDARRGARARARPSVAVRPDPRRSRRRGPHRARRRPPADDAGRSPLARRRAPATRTRIGPRRSTTTPSTGWPTAGWRGYEISNWAGPGHESRHNLVYWERRPYEAVGPGAHAFDGADPALERGPTRRLPAARSRRPTAASPPLPPGGSETIDPATAAAEAVILGLRPDTRPLAGRARAAARAAPRLGAGGRAARASDARDDRVVLTTRGRLLSNELFARLV